MNNVVSKNTETKKICTEVVVENIEVVKEQEKVLNEATNVNVNINIKVKKEKATGLKRNIIDKFYTTEATVNKCMSLVKKHIVIEDNDLCIEPSAGDGSFIKLIKRMFKNYIFYDIKPDHKEIIEKDYLCIDKNCKKCNEYNKIKNDNDKNTTFTMEWDCPYKYITSLDNLVSESLNNIFQVVCSTVCKLWLTQYRDDLMKIYGGDVHAIEYICISVFHLKNPHL